MRQYKTEPQVGRNLQCGGALTGHSAWGEWLRMACSCHRTHRRHCSYDCRGAIGRLGDSGLACGLLCRCPAQCQQHQQRRRRCRLPCHEGLLATALKNRQQHTTVVRSQGAARECGKRARRGWAEGCSHELLGRLAARTYAPATWNTRLTQRETGPRGHKPSWLPPLTWRAAAKAPRRRRGPLRLLPPVSSVCGRLNSL